MLRPRIEQIRLKVMTPTGVDSLRANSNRCFGLSCKTEPVALLL